MQILDILIANPKESIKLAIFIGANIYLIKHIIQRKYLKRQYHKIKQQKIWNLAEILQLLKNKRQSQLKPGKSEQKSLQKTYLIKVQPLKQQVKFIFEDNIHSNQYWCIEPSLKTVASSIIGLINSEKKLKLGEKIILANQTWKAKINSINSSFQANQNHKEAVSIDGFGEIVDSQIFSIKTQFKEDFQRGFFKRLYQNIAYIFQIIFFYKQVSHLDQHMHKRIKQDRSPSILGPIIGKIKYMLSLIPGKSIIMQARLQNNKIIPSLSSSSRQFLLDYFSAKVYQKNAYIMIFSLASYVLYRYICPFWRTKLRHLKVSLKKIGQRRNSSVKIFKSTEPDLTESKLCIICYTNIRNTVLFNCKHVIICDQCKAVYNQAKCPLCKQEIQEHHLFYTQ